jgi:hypothetical protein
MSNPVAQSEIGLSEEGVAAPTDLPAQPLPELAPVLEAHAPHEPIHTWKGFLIHIAAIAIGLLLALGLEQTVEALHHAHQRSDLEQQMRAVLLGDLQSDKRLLQDLQLRRGYFSDLLNAINARLQNRPQRPSTPDAKQMGSLLIFPSLAPLDVAKLNGTAALLPADRIQLFNRIDTLLGILSATFRQSYGEFDMVSSFHERYLDSRETIESGKGVNGPPLDVLSVSELLEYRALVATAAKTLDALMDGIRLFDLEARQILAGIPTEDALIQRMRTDWGKEGRVPDPPAE